MDKPVKLRLKPVEVDAMLYTGENVDELIAWLRTLDQDAHHCAAVLPPSPWRYWNADGATIIPVPQYITIHLYFAEFNIYKGQWLFKNARGRLSIHDAAEVQTDYERVPDDDQKSRNTNV